MLRFLLLLLVLVPTARVTHEGLPEISGLTPSMRAPGWFWALNDSGNPPVLHALDAQGRVGPEVRVEGATNQDWEALAGGDGLLYVGDVGDNASRRSFRTVYVLEEPDPCVGGPVKPVREMRLRFPDQVGGQRLHDCEAMFVSEGRLWLLAKHRDLAGNPSPTSRLYRVDRADTVVSVQDLEGLGGFVTDAALAPDGRTLAVLTLSAQSVGKAWIWLYDFDGRRLSRARGLELTGARQAEALAFLSPGMLLVANEQRDLYQVPLSEFQDAFSLVSDLFQDQQKPGIAGVFGLIRSRFRGPGRPPGASILLPGC